MSRRAPLSPAARLTVVSLAAAAAGVVMMTISGVEFTTPIPPGLFILLVPAGLVAFGRWRWTPPIAALASLFIVVSYVPSGSLVRLFEPRPLGTFIGLWLQLVGAFVAAGPGQSLRFRAIANVVRPPEEAHQASGPGAEPTLPPTILSASARSQPDSARFGSSSHGTNTSGSNAC